MVPGGVLASLLAQSDEISALVQRGDKEYSHVKKALSSSFFSNHFILFFEGGVP